MIKLPDILAYNLLALAGATIFICLVAILRTSAVRKGGIFTKSVVLMLGGIGTNQLCTGIAIILALATDHDNVAAGLLRVFGLMAQATGIIYFTLYLIGVITDPPKGDE